VMGVRYWVMGKGKVDAYAILFLTPNIHHPIPN